MNTQTQEALKMAIEWIENPFVTTPALKTEVLNACKKALEQPAQEPVAWTDEYKNFLEWDKESLCDKAVCKEHEAIPLYTHPHQWQGLTDDEIQNILTPIVLLDNADSVTDYEIARAIEQALKEKNT